jgi:hypothetical protein
MKGESITRIGSSSREVGPVVPTQPRLVADCHESNRAITGARRKIQSQAVGPSRVCGRPKLRHQSYAAENVRFSAQPTGFER